MAFEDRCSPQGAPSPPGIPQSPQTTNSTQICSQTTLINGYSPTEYEMSLLSAEPFIPVRIKQETIITESPASSPTFETSPQSQHSSINFSISNILSGTYGINGSVGKSYQKNCDKKNVLFRPYEIPECNERTQIKNVEIKNNVNYNNICSNSTLFSIDRSILTGLEIQASQLTHQYHRLNEIIDYSKRSPPFVTTPISINPLLNKSNPMNLFGAFNVSNYPKIQEEILQNSHRKYTVSDISDSALSKIPPLGNLCKTVSQIGQPNHMAVKTSPKRENDLFSPTGHRITPPLVQRQLSSPISNTSSSPMSPATNSSLHQSHVQPSSRDSGMESSDDTKSECGNTKEDSSTQLWPAWVFCTRYSDRPSSGPRYRKPKQPKDKSQENDEKRPRTAFSSEQLARLKREFNENRYLNEQRRQQLSAELGLNEAQIKIWFQNKRAKLKKSSGSKNPLALQLMAQGLYNHSTVPLTEEEEELERKMKGEL